MSEHDDEILRTREPEDDILCRTCKSRLKQIERVPTLKRWKYGKCHMYEVKPHGVLYYMVMSEVAAYKIMEIRQKYGMET